MAERPPVPSRRMVLAATALASAAAPMAARAKGRADTSLASVTADLERYFSLGVKASGGTGDQATGAWMESELTAAGFTVTRQPIDVPYFTPTEVTLKSGSATAAVIPQAVVVPTGPAGIEAPLAVRAPWTLADTRCDGAIALVVLPYRRWSSVIDPGVRRPVEAAFAAGAVAVVIVTTGPTGEALALNAPAKGPVFSRPVAVLAPRDAQPFLVAAQSGGRARLTVAGEGGWRPGFNIAATLDRGSDHGLVVSTPRSGWYTCAGERGGGAAVWLALARWSPGGLPGTNLTFTSATGHEYEYHGAEHFLKELAPPRATTKLWVHLGANVAARDWNEMAGLTALPGADPQRVLMVSESLAPAARRLFAGQAGLEAVRIGDIKSSAGELTGILQAGYPTALGIFGAHRFHHSANDDMRCAHPEATLAAAVAVRDLIKGVLKS